MDLTRYSADMILLVIISVACLGWAKELPDYIKPCKLNDTKFEQCALENGNKAMPILLKGDKHYKLVNHAPLVIPEVALQGSGNLKVKITNLVVDFQGTKLFSFNVDQVKRTMRVKAGKDFYMNGNYMIDGRVLLLPITGEGFLNITLYNLVVDYLCHYDLVDKDGDDYMRVLDDEASFTNTKSAFYFSNLFNGNKELGEQMNKLINENEKEFLGEFYPTIQEIMKSISHTFVRAIFTSVPFKKLFL